MLPPALPLPTRPVSSPAPISPAFFLSPDQYVRFDEEFGFEPCFTDPTPQERMGTNRFYHNLVAAAHKHGVKQVLVYTQTFRRGVLVIKAHERFKHLTKLFLAKAFPSRALIWDVKDYENPHLHGLLFVPFDVTQGFDSSVYQQIRAIEDQAGDEGRDMTPQENRQLRSLRNNLTTNPLLKELLRKLRAACSTCNCGRFDIAPVSTTIEQCCGYMRKRLLESYAARWSRPKGMNLFRYVGLPKVQKKVPSNTPRAQAFGQYHAMVTAVITGTSQIPRSDLKLYLGRGWSQRVLRVVKKIWVIVGSNTAQCPQDLINAAADEVMNGKPGADTILESIDQALNPDSE